MPLGKSIVVDEGDVHAPTEAGQVRLDHIEMHKRECVQFHLHHPIHDSPFHRRFEYAVLPEEWPVHPRDPRLVQNQMRHISGHK